MYSFVALSPLLVGMMVVVALKLHRHYIFVKVGTTLSLGLYKEVN